METQPTQVTPPQPEKKTFWQKAKAKMGRFFQELWYFISSFFFLGNFLAMLGVIAAFIAIIFWWLTCHTNHGESLQVPDYVGMPVDAVKKQAKQRGLEIIILDSVFAVGATPFTVKEQNPKPFSRVKENRSIYMTIYKATADLVHLPSLKGSYDFENYSRKLQRLELKGVVQKELFDPKQAQNTILYAFYEGEKITEGDIEKGVKVARGSTIEFVVTKRTSNVVPIPNLVCKTFSEAEFMLISNSLNIGETIGEGNYVYRQTPDYSGNGTMRKGEMVTLYLSQDLPDGCD